MVSVATLPPPPGGVAQVPSPLQNVVELALVPLFRLDTDKFPVTPVERGNPVQFVSVPLVGVPRTGVTSVGVLANTFAPVPVSSVNAAAKFVELGVAKNAATFAPSPDTPVDMGNPVALVSVPLEGVPNAPPLYRTVPPAPNATELESVPVNVSVFDAVNVFPSAMVRVADVAGAVIATLFTDVAVATPIVGVTNVGELPKLVKLDAVTPEASVAPVSVPAAAVTVMFAVPSKDTPLIVLAVCSAVAVPALPVTEV